MKRKLSSVLAGVLAVALTVGAPVFAASSSTTSNTSWTSIVKQEEYVVPRPHTKSYTAAVVRDTNKHVTRVASDYSQVTDKQAIATATAGVASKDAAVKALSDYVAALGTSKVAFGPYKMRMYKAGVSVWSDFGTFIATYGVGNKYDGQTATVYQYCKDGTVKTTPVVVAQGKVVYPMTEMGTVIIAFN